MMLDSIQIYGVSYVGWKKKKYNYLIFLVK